MKTGPSLFDASRFQVVSNHKGSERGELLDKFLARLNPPRVAGNFKPLSHGRLSAILSHIPTDELYPFFRQCEGANSFSRFFWWSLKPKDTNMPHES
jgi:hypothetical protein